MKDLIKSLGANEKEARTFLVLLELGAQPVSIVAKRMNKPRSSTYLILEKLKSLHLIEEFERKGIKYVRCIPAKNLEGIFKRKKRRLQQSLDELQEKLPQLEAIENRLSITPSVRHFEGVEKVKEMYFEIKGDFYAYFNPAAVKEIMSGYHLLAERSKRNKWNAKELLVDSPDAKKYKEKYHSKRHQIKLLPKKTKFFSEIIICEDRFYMISYGEKEISATEIKNTSLTNSLKVLFDLLWATQAPG